jgi:formylglycine-generating enzyme required for sulfatase activity
MILVVVLSLTLLPAPFAWIDIPAGRVIVNNQTFDVPPFAIAKYPITNAQFKLFIDAGGYDTQRWWTSDGWQARLAGIAYVGSSWKPTGKAWIEPRYWRDKKRNGADYPVVGVSWFEAAAFCAWLRETTGENIVLPSEQQWQRAAQGDDGRAYPYGAKFDKNRCNFNTSRTTPVRHYEGKGDSPFGVVDMSGNVWEWCLTDYDTGHQDENRTCERRVLRGGSWWGDDSDWLRAGYRLWLTPVDWNVNRGFRLALP